MTSPNSGDKQGHLPDQVADDSKVDAFIGYKLLIPAVVVVAFVAIAYKWWSSNVCDEDVEGDNPVDQEQAV